MGSLFPPLNLVTSQQPSPVFPPSRFHSIAVASSLSVSRSRFFLATLLCSPGRSRRGRLHFSVSSSPEEKDSEDLVQALQVPEAWVVPSNAYSESVWLKGSLHKWLDDEYCPEPTNFEISRLAAQSYYESLISKETDLGEILLKMVRRLETISFQQSFHGPFSAANAAVLLITQRIHSTRK